MPSVDPEHDSNHRERERARRGLRSAGRLLLLLSLGLVAAEAALWLRDEGAFPRVNVYVADPQLGVRLQPGASTRLRLGDDPPTAIEINSAGYRGAEWPAPPRPGEIVVIGDSQVFGLGVDEAARFSELLAERTGRPVLNAGVPTYGPREYLEVARELLTARAPETVVVVLNFADDPFELERPNVGRHVVQDGWAVRRATAPTEVWQFPGRAWLLSRSHAVQAWRRWLGEVGDEASDGAASSEGEWQDLVPASLRGEAALGEGDARESGEIVGPGRSAEVGRSLLVKAARIQAAVSARQAYKKQRRAQEKAQAARLDELRGEASTLADRREAAQAELAASAPPAWPGSVFDAYLEQFKALCGEHGAELVVVALPLDVQVDGGEWTKYGVAQGPDLRPSQVFLTDLIASAEARRIRGLDATAALRAAQPGAFLEHDFHLAARGHAAVAEALAQRLEQPLPPRTPGPGLPEGTRYAPTGEVWRAAPAIALGPEGWATGTVQHVGGWLKLRLSAADDVEPIREIVVREGGSPAAMMMQTPTGMTLVTPLAVGAPLTARLRRLDGAGELRVRWEAAAEGPRLVAEVVGLEEAPDGPLVFSRPPEALCDCDVCDEMWGDPSLFEACARAYPEAGEGRCEALLGCVRHDPLFAPECPEGQVHAFASNACFTPCDADNPCAEGRCTPWHGAAVCVPRR